MFSMESQTKSSEQSPGKFLIWQLEEGEKRTFHGYEITPEARVLGVKLPFAGYMLNRPVGIRVRKGDEEHRIPIVDPTRIAQILIYGSAIVLTVIAMRATRRNAE